LKVDITLSVRNLSVFAKPFPIAYPNFLIFKNIYGVDICIIKNYGELDPESRKNLLVFLDKAYTIPLILEVEKIETSGDEFEWEFLTTRGRQKSELGEE